ncbi:hypothetical protein LXA43DRAFT_1053300 [Ganoderma leucocontextum]|nr:hypothetical protein LXA43DRAFT_1053300 [Ganoderma leucocontextum]
MESQKRSKRRLRPEAYAILNDYFVNVSQWPDPTDQEELAEQVRRVPGCEFYTTRQVYSYFANNRAKVIKNVGTDVVLPTGIKKRRSRRKASQADVDPGPSLQTMSDADPDSVLSKLNVLLDDEPDPSPEVVEIWAESLGHAVVPEHILTYAFLRRADNHQDLKTEPNESQLPSPAQSPELRPEGPASEQQPLQYPAPFPSLDVSTNPFPPDRSPNEKLAECPSTALPPSTPSTNNELAEPHSQSASDAVPPGDENAAGSIPPPAFTVGPDEQVEQVRAALLEASTRDAHESPKTFVDFARWLKAHNEDSGAFLHTPREARCA